MNPALKNFLLNMTAEEKAETVRLLAQDETSDTEWQTIQDIMKMYSLSRSTVIRLITLHNWRTMRTGRRILVKKKDVQEVFHA